MKKVILLFLILFIGRLLFSQEIEITPLIIKGMDISPFPSFPLKLPQGIIREEKIRKEEAIGNYFRKLPREKKLWKGGNKYFEFEDGGGSFGKYSSRIFGIVKGRNNSFLFQCKKDYTSTFREEKKNSFDDYLLFSFKKFAINGGERKVGLNLLGPIGKGKVGERHIYSSIIGTKLNGEMEVFAKGNFFKIDEGKKYSGNTVNFGINSSNFTFNLRKETLNNFYSSGEGEFSYFSLNYPWGVRILSDGNGIFFFPQYNFSKAYKNLNFIFSMEGKRNSSSLLSYYENSMIGLRKKFLPSEKVWEGKVGIEGRKFLSFTSYFFYQRGESLLSFEKTGNLFEPTIFPKANFIGFGGRFQKKMKKKFLLEGEGMLRKEVHNAKIPYFPLSWAKLSLIKKLEGGKGKCFLEYNGRRCFERGKNREIEGYTRIGLNFEKEIFKNLSFSFSIKNLVGKEGEFFKGYPITPTEYYLSFKINW